MKRQKAATQPQENSSLERGVASSRRSVSVERCTGGCSLPSTQGGEGRGEEAASTNEVPPSPTLPPLVPRKGREAFLEWVKSTPRGERKGRGRRHEPLTR